MYLLTCLHSPAEQAHQDIGTGWGSPDILGETTALADSRDCCWAGLQEHWQTALWCCVSMSHNGYTHRHHAAPAHLLAVPLPARGASLLLELRAWARLCLTAVGPLLALVQTLTRKKNLFCTDVTDHSQSLFLLCGQQHKVTGTAGFLLSQAGEEGLQPLYSEIGLSLLKRPNTKQLLRTGKESPVFWPPKTVNDITFSLRSQRKSIVWSALRNEHFICDWLK